MNPKSELLSSSSPSLRWHSRQLLLRCSHCCRRPLINARKMRREILSQALIILATLLLLEGDAFSVPHVQRNTPGVSLSLSMVDSRVRSPPDIEREVVRLGRSGKTDEALDTYRSVLRPSIRLLNAAIDACSRATPTRLEQAFDLLQDGIEKKNLKPNVFTFGSLVSACSRARKADRAIKVLRSMEVSG